MLLLKGSMLHIFQRKSWRQTGRELNVAHTPLYNFSAQFSNTKEFELLIEYFIERRILLSFSDEKYLTREFLETDEIVEKSLLEFEETRV
jgi:hypothetical protein